MLDIIDVDIAEARRFAQELRERKEHRRADLVERLAEKALGHVAPGEGVARREWMSTGEAARLTGVSAQTIKNWVRKGELEGRQLGGRVKVSRRGVMDYVRNLRPSSVPASHLSEDVQAAGRLDAEVMAALPATLRARVEWLLARRDAGEELSSEETAELRRLVREATRVASQFLAERSRC